MLPWRRPVSPWPPAQLMKRLPGPRSSSRGPGCPRRDAASTRSGRENRYESATRSIPLSRANRYRSATKPLPIRHPVRRRREHASRARTDQSYQQVCGQIAHRSHLPMGREMRENAENPRTSATRALPFRYPSQSRPRLMGPLRRGYRDGGYKSAALPTELRRPNVRQCPIPRKRPLTSLWAEIPVCVSRALSPTFCQ